MATIGFLHTSPVHTSTFDELVAQLEAGFDTVVVVDEGLLSEARRLGPEHAGVRDGIAAALSALERAGAEIVVCTCSTIGEQAEQLGRRRGQHVNSCRSTDR